MNAQLYHAHHSRHMEDLPFWLRLAREWGERWEKPVSILELGCGTGRALLPLARAGYPLCGVELSGEMLAALRQGLAEQPAADVTLLRADMTRLPLAGGFSLALLPCNTYSTFTREQRAAILSGVRRCLQEGGWFAASLPNPALFKRLPRRSAAELEESFPHPADGEPVQVSSAWERSAQDFTVRWIYDHLLPDGRVEREAAEAIHTLDGVRDYLDELRAAGFREPRQYGDFDGSPYAPASSPAWIFVAE
ncbi:MAG: class I SAM-dependent methyltransferase [Chloroflexi bacterium]|nr:class I SAM-dependent methyltransferase [Chloroflexota bacterium]